MSKTIKDRVLELGASIKKGLSRLDQPNTSTVVPQGECISFEALWDLVENQTRELSEKLVQPTRADVVQASETLNDIRKSADEAIDRIDAWLKANPTGPEVK